MASNLTNNGSARIAIPELKFDGNNFFHTLVIEVGVSSFSLMNSGQRQDIFSNIFVEISESGLRILKQSQYLIGAVSLGQDAQRIACEDWFNTASSINDQEKLPPCPCTLSLASEPNSGFKKENFSSIVMTANAFSTNVNDDYHQFFHPNTANCYRQRLTDS